MIFPEARMLRHPVLSLVCRGLLGGMMIYAGLGKLTDLPAFAEAVEHYRLLPLEAVNLFAMALPAVEVIAGLCLVLGWGQKGALFLTTLLLAIFLAAVESALWRELDIECGCFGTSDASMVGIQLLVRDGFFLMLTLPVWFCDKPMWTLDARWRRTLAGAETERASGADV